MIHEYISEFKSRNYLYYCLLMGTLYQLKILTIWLPALAIALIAVAIIYTVNWISAIALSASQVRSATEAKVKAGGLDKSTLKNHSVYVIA